MEEKKGLAKFFLQLGFVIVVTFLFSNFIGLARGGFEATEILRLQTFYIIGGIFSIGLICFKLYQVYLTKEDKIFGKSIAFSSLGEKPHIPFFKRFTMIQIFFLSLIIFLILGLINITYVAQTAWGSSSYTAVGFLQTEQFTVTDSVIYSALLIPGSENLGAALMFAFVVVLLGVLARKGKLPASTHSYLIYILMPIVFIIFGIGNHLLRYRGSEIALTTVGIFWGIGGLITALTGTFLIFWNLHIINNLFVDLARYFSNESILIMTIGVILVLIVVYAIVYSGRIFGKKYSQDEIS